MSTYSKQCDHAYWGILGQAEWFCVSSPCLYRIGPAPELEGWIASAFDFTSQAVATVRVVTGTRAGIFPTRNAAAQACMDHAGNADCTHSFEIVDLKSPNVEIRSVEVERFGATHYLWPGDVLGGDRRAEIERQIDQWALEGWTVGGVLGAAVGEKTVRPGNALLQLGRIKRG